jgi:hypothetical protein
MEIDTTDFFNNRDPSDFSASRAEAGKNAPSLTWAAALAEAADSPLLQTEDQIEALRDHMRGYGAWEPEEIDAWDAAHCNALFIQLVAGDIRDAGISDASDEKEWADYQKRAKNGQCSGAIYRGDNGRVYYYLGN